MGLTNFAMIVHDRGGIIGTAVSWRHTDQMTHLIVLSGFMDVHNNERLCSTPCHPPHTGLPWPDAPHSSRGTRAVSGNLRITKNETAAAAIK
jgi:hypothetical protein